MCVSAGLLLTKKTEPRVDLNTLVCITTTTIVVDLSIVLFCIVKWVVKKES